MGNTTVAYASANGSSRFELSGAQGVDAPIELRSALPEASTQFLDVETGDVGSTSVSKAKYAAPQPIRLRRIPPELANTAVIQVWEGTVLGSLPDSDAMSVKLVAKMGELPEHTAEIDIEWVQEQDRDLVVPGAIFYLTLYKLTRHGGTVVNSQELRFRRRPNWTPKQVEQIHDIAAAVLSKAQRRPLAE